MITWDNNVCCTNIMCDKLENVKQLLNERKFKSLLYYCIAFSTNKDGLLDIYNMGELMFRYYRDSNEDIHIVGLAHSKESAIQLVQNIVEQIYKETGDLDVRLYFNQKGQ